MNRAVNNTRGEVMAHDQQLADALREIERLRAALQEITDLCKRSPANPFLADWMDRVAIAALITPDRK